MTVGFPVDKRDIDSKAGQLAVSLRDVFRQIQTFKARMDAATDGQLLALGFTQADVDTLRSAYIDLDQLRAVYEGTATRTPAYDYRTFAKLLTGVV